MKPKVLLVGSDNKPRSPVSARMQKNITIAGSRVCGPCQSVIRSILCSLPCSQTSFGWDNKPRYFVCKRIQNDQRMQVQDPWSPCQSSVDYGNTSINQHALKVSGSSKCWTLFGRRSLAVYTHLSDRLLQVIRLVRGKLIRSQHNLFSQLCRVVCFCFCVVVFICKVGNQSKLLRTVLTKSKTQTPD